MNYDYIDYVSYDYAASLSRIFEISTAHKAPSLFCIERPMTYIQHLRYERQLYNAKCYDALYLVGNYFRCKTTTDRLLLKQSEKTLKEYEKLNKLKDCVGFVQKRNNRIKRSRLWCLIDDNEQSLAANAKGYQAVVCLSLACLKNCL